MSQPPVKFTAKASDPKGERQPAPQTLGRYRILNEVGRGATAFVYKAYDPQLDRFLAIKVLREELAKDDDYRDSFLREARLAAQLTHPGIVTIFDVGVAEDKPYIGMELLEGATLEHVLKSQGKLPIKTVLAIAWQLSGALNYAHEQGVVHRDIKPGNIVVLKDKKTVKLTDFGIAQLEDVLGSVGKQADKVVGTPEYMAPEQVLGHPMDNRSDLYSFGVLLYRMLMGKPPFVSRDIGDLFKQIVKSKAPLIQNEETKIQDDIQDLIRKLLQKKAAKRFQDASLVSNELRMIQNKLGGKKATRNNEFVSLRLRWTATMASVVFIAMCISLVIVYFVQNNALSGITFDYGRSIARMIAFESSESILLEDSIGLNALVNESSQNEQLKSVFVLDVDSKILASTDSNLVGQAFLPPEPRELLQTIEQTLIYQREMENKEILFDIVMPILYSGKPLGTLYVTYSGNSMYAASKTTLVTMLTVMMITLLVVFMVTLVLARRASKDYQRVTQALRKMTTGRVDARLISQRNDEAGQLFVAFNQLASYLEGRLDPQLGKTGRMPKKDKAAGNAVNVQEQAVADKTVKLDITQRRKPKKDK